MKKIYLGVIICFVTLNQTKANTIYSNDELRVVYYSTVEFVETPLSYIKGSVPLKSDVALSRNHYRFSYNPRNRLVSIAFYNGNTPKNRNHTANYLIQAHRTEFSYDDAIERVTFFNTNGKQISVLGNCSQFVYKLNQLGLRESLHFIDVSGNRVESSWNIFEYTWEHLNDGTVIEDRFDTNGKQVSLRPSFKFYRLKLFFNNAGHIALMQNIDKDGNLVENSTGASQDNLTTNSDGNLLQWQVLNNQHQLEKGNGPDVAIGIQKVNEFGYEVGLENQDENGNPIYNKYGICRSNTEYDKFGNLSQRFFYNEANEPSNHKHAGYHNLKIEYDKFGKYRERLSYYDVNNKPTLHKTRGYHAVKDEYNRNKNLIKISFLDTNNKPTIHKPRGYHASKYKYNRNKSLIKISYLDTNGVLVNRKDNGVSYIVYQYNSNGERTGVLRFDKEGKNL